MIMCSCNKKSSSKRQILNTGGTIGSGSPRPVNGQISAGASPAQIRALGIQSSVAPKSANKLNADRLRIEKIRREAVRKAFNK